MTIKELTEDIATIIIEYAMHEVRAVTDPEHKIELPDVYDYVGRILNIPIGGEVKKKCCNGSPVCKGEGFIICPRLLMDCVKDER